MNKMIFKSLGALKQYAERSPIMYIVFSLSPEDDKSYLDYFSKHPTSPEESIILIDRSANEICFEPLAYPPKGTCVLAFAEYALIGTCESVEEMQSMRAECQEWISGEYIE